MDEEHQEDGDIEEKDQSPSFQQEDQWQKQRY